MNDQYTHYLKGAYYAHAAPVYPVAAGYTEPSTPKQAVSLTDIDTGASLGSLVDDLSCSPFAAKLPGEEDPVGGLFEEKEQILRARAKHLADTLASRYELKDKAVSMMDFLNATPPRLLAELAAVDYARASGPLAKGAARFARRAGDRRKSKVEHGNVISYGLLVSCSRVLLPCS